MTRLLIATGIFHPETGGPATYLYHLLPHLQEHGYEIHVLTYGDPKTTGNYPYPVTRIPRSAMPVRLLGYATAAQKLIRWADMIYIHSMALPLYYPPNLPHKPRIMKVVGDQAWERSVRNHWISPLTDVDHFQMNQYRHPMVQAARQLRRRAVRSVDGVIIPSRYLRQMVIRWGVPSIRTHVVYNALPPDAHKVTLTQAEARAELHLHPTHPIILTVARLLPWKGIDDFTVALSAVKNSQLIVAGDGSYRNEFETFARERGMEDRVAFLGNVSRERVALYMRAADYVGLYSGYEGLSHVLLESLQLGTPVIASHKGGNPEIVGHNVNGLLVPYHDTHALSEALVTAFQPGKREQLAANTKIGMEKFDYDRMVMETIGTLESFRLHA